MSQSNRAGLGGAGRDAIVLDDRDNVATALRSLEPGETITLAQGTTPLRILVEQPVPLCHKIAIAELQPGDAIYKYGEVIGEARSVIRPGSHVHVHNLASLRGKRPAR